MISLKQQKHIAFFDQRNSYYASYLFYLSTPQDNNEEDNDLEYDQFLIEVKINHKYTFEWHSDYYNYEVIKQSNFMPQCPLALEHYFNVYKDPKILKLKFTIKNSTVLQDKQQLYQKDLGKLIIKTHFLNDCFTLPVNILDTNNKKNNKSQNQKIIISTSTQKKSLCVIRQKKKEEVIICNAQIIQMQEVTQASGFISDKIYPDGYEVSFFTFNKRIQAQNIVIAKGLFIMSEYKFGNVPIKIFALNSQPFFMPGLLLHLQQLKLVIGQIQPLIIFQNINTDIQGAYNTVFYTDSSCFYQRLFRAYLYDKVKDKWIVQGMINYNRSNKHFQDVMRQLMDLATEGEELVPLQCQTFYFDKVWRLKAIFFYHVLSNFKTQRDYSSASLANLIIQQSRRKKITSNYLFKKLKNKYGLNNFRTFYQVQFVKCTGINRIFYQIIDIKKQNKIKIIVRQKALANKAFRLYNYFRIKLQQQFDMVSPLTLKIINKNKLLETQKKKQLAGPLAVPSFLNMLPYFKGSLTVQTDANEMPFIFQLRQENIMEKKENVTSKIRAPNRKSGEGQRSYEGFGWIMIDTAHVFPALYKNEKVEEDVILQKVKKKYDSQNEEIKVLNCISSRDHSNNQKICKALIQKVKIHLNSKQNCTINVKRKILQILPIFLSKATDYNLWQQTLKFLKLYEPPCHDHSQDGYYFLLSLLDCLGQIQYKAQFSYYFESFHKIMIDILLDAPLKPVQRQERLKMVLFQNMTKWVSRHSFTILQQIYIELKLCRASIRANLPILKTIFNNIFTYLNKLKAKDNKIVKQIQNLCQQLINNDTSFQLFGIKYKFQLLNKSQNAPSNLIFLKQSFKMLQLIQEQNQRKFQISLQIFKDILSLNKKAYGLQIQLTLSQNQSFFIADYLWRQLNSEISTRNHKIRLQWIKIYRIFYFYYTPIVTLKKIKNNHLTNDFKGLSTQTAQYILKYLKDFFPDHRWFSGYDSRDAKQLKKKYEQPVDNKKKKKSQQFNFRQNNIITKFIKENPEKAAWDQLGRQAIKIIISKFQVIEQQSQGKQAQKYKNILKGFKNIQQNLKRGKMPQTYSFQILKDQINYEMSQFNFNLNQEMSSWVQDLLRMVDDALDVIKQQRKRRLQQQKDETKILIDLGNFDGQEQQQNIVQNRQDDLDDGENLFLQEIKEGEEQEEYEDEKKREDDEDQEEEIQQN